MDRFPIQPGDNLESCESSEVLVQAIPEEKVETGNIVMLINKWH